LFFIVTGAHQGNRTYKHTDYLWLLIPDFSPQVCINLLKFFYERLALWLTNWENPPTETDYKDSFTYKMFLFQFVNTYSSIFYIAFFKLNLVVGTPGNYRRLAGGRLDGCGAGGCLLDLCIQLVIIMVGQQIIGNVTEIAIP